MSKRNHLKERLNEKLQAITFSTLVVGIDIAKKNQWAWFVDCRGIEHGKRNYKWFIPLGIEYKNKNISERYIDKFQIVR